PNTAASAACPASAPSAWLHPRFQGQEPPTNPGRFNFLGAAMTLILPWNESLHQTRGATSLRPSLTVISCERCLDGLIEVVGDVCRVVAAPGLRPRCFDRVETCQSAPVLAQDRFGSGSEPRIRMLRLRGDGRVARSERWCGAVIASLLPVAGCSTVRRKNLGGQLGGIRHRARRGRLWRDVPERCGGSRVPRRRTGTIASAWKGGCAAGATRRHVVLALRDRVQCAVRGPRARGSFGPSCCGRRSWMSRPPLRARPG